MKRIQFLRNFFILFAVIIMGRAMKLQIGANPKLENLFHRQFTSNVKVLPRRGLIYDRNGEGLAISLKVRSLFIRPEVLKNDVSNAEKKHILQTISRIVHMSLTQLYRKFNSGKGFIWVKRQLSTTEEQSIKNHGLLDEGDGIGLAEETKRFYPNNELAAHVLGSVGVDGQGLEGLELYYDSILAGEGSKLSSTKDARGRRIFRDDKVLTTLKDGQSFILTLDKAIQYESEKILKQAVEEFKAKAATVIVAEVTTGEILALANYPTFNPNHSKNAIADHRRNRAVTDTYEPGSSFKPFVIAMALEKGYSPKSKIYCEKGSFKVADTTISESESHEKFEYLTMGEIIKYSSNIGAAKVALNLGSNTIIQLMDQLGVGKKTGIDLPGEVSGSFDRHELKSKVRLANTGFGQGFTVTPLQMLSYYLAIANGGTLVTPKLVKTIFSEDQGEKLGNKQEIIKVRKLFSSPIIKQITSILESVPQHGGTGIQAQLEEWSVAGKTGTAQKVDRLTHHYSHQKHINSFIGFSPVKNSKLVALVIIDEPQTKMYASETAAPVFKKIMKTALLREQITPSNLKERVLELSNQSAIDSLSNSSQVSGVDKPLIFDNKLPKTNEHSQIKLPNLKGMTVREVLRALSQQPIAVQVIGSGYLQEQIPPSEQWLEAGSKVKLIFRQ